MGEHWVLSTEVISPKEGKLAGYLFAVLAGDEGDLADEDAAAGPLRLIRALLPRIQDPAMGHIARCLVTGFFCCQTMPRLIDSNRGNEEISKQSTSDMISQRKTNPGYLRCRRAPYEAGWSSSASWVSLSAAGW